MDLGVTWSIIKLCSDWKPFHRLINQITYYFITDSFRLMCFIPVEYWWLLFWCEIVGRCMVIIILHVSLYRIYLHDSVTMAGGLSHSIHGSQYNFQLVFKWWAYVRGNLIVDHIWPYVLRSIYTNYRCYISYSFF